MIQHSIEDLRDAAEDLGRVACELSGGCWEQCEFQVQGLWKRNAIAVLIATEVVAGADPDEAFARFTEATMGIIPSDKEWFTRAVVRRG